MTHKRPPPDAQRRPRKRQRAASSVALPLFAWAAAQPATFRPRIVLLHGCPDADGEPRPALLMPGQRVPRAFPTLAAALAAQRQAEGGR